MRRSSRTILSLLMLAFLLTGMGGGGFNSKEFVHDLEHHGQATIVALDSAHAGAREASKNPKFDPLDEIAHQLLHAVSELHFLASAAVSSSREDSARILVPAASVPSLPLAELDSPFRPPRSSAFI